MRIGRDHHDRDRCLRRRHGPGPFTGLRVGIVTARTLAAVAGRPLHGVCSLDVIAAQWQDAPDEFVVASDARRKEFYWALYRDGIRVGEPRVSAPEVIPDLPAAGPVPDDPAGPRFLDAAVLAARWADLPVVDGEPSTCGPRMLRCREPASRRCPPQGAPMIIRTAMPADAPALTQLELFSRRGNAGRRRRGWRRSAVMTASWRWPSPRWRV